MPIDPTQHQTAADAVSWTTLIGPAVVAAAVSGLFLAFTSWRRFGVDRELADRKIKADLDLAERKFEFDHRLAERKFEFDKQLAEHKVDLDAGLAERKVVADLALTERRFALDQALAVWRRRYELAEQVLAAVYEARDALNFARSRGIYEGEGETRQAAESESDGLRKKRNSAFVPIERLARNAKSFSTIEALRDVVSAHFGSEVTKCIQEVAEARHMIISTSSLIVRLMVEDEDWHSNQNLAPLRAALYGNRPDDTDKKVDAAIQQLEAVCKPVLLAQAPS